MHASINGDAKNFTGNRSPGAHTLAKIGQQVRKTKILKKGADEYQGGILRVDLGSYASKNMIMN